MGVMYFSSFWKYFLSIVGYVQVIFKGICSMYWVSHFSKSQATFSDLNFSLRQNSIVIIYILVSLRLVYDKFYK